MKPETIQKILVLLKEDMECKRDTLLRTVEGVYSSAAIDERIKEYKAAYNAYSDFDDWMNEQEE